jgi:hypothetical protein
MATPSAESSSNHIFTAHSDFLRPAVLPNHPPTSLLLRGVNLTSKFPSAFPLPPKSADQSIPGSTRESRDAVRAREAGTESHYTEEEAGIWTAAENGGQDGWYVGHPLVLDGAEVSSGRM